MRPREDELIDPEIAEQLDAIDATLAGEPVAPRFAELAELALLLAASRPEDPRPEFAAELDRRVEGRFGRAGHAAAGVDAAGGRGGSAAGRDGTRAGGSLWRRWGLAPVLGAAATALAAVVVAVVLVTSGSGNYQLDMLSAPPTPTTSVNSSLAAILGPARTIHGRAGVKSAAVPHTVPVPEVRRPAAQYATGSAIAAGSPNAAGAINSNPSPAPVPNGRKIVQSSMLQLGAPAGRIDAVAQGVFDVVGSVNGIVDSSNVSSTGGPGASAQFQLRVPSSLLSQALTALSRLHYAHVIARTDNTRDVNSSFVSGERQIADAQAALTRLRAQLAVATVATQIATLRAQIAGEKATIARVQGSLRSLNRQVNYSRVEVSIVAAGPVSPPRSGGGGFGLHKAGHDALRVLEVTAGVALIALAVLVPLGLLAALVWWLALAVQRRRRERALDLA